MKIVLMGFMCSGKSRVGKVLSQKTGLSFFDTDSMIEKQTGKKIADIITGLGEDVFRDMERQAVEEASSRDNRIIATGGGAPMDPVNMKHLKKDSLTVWLKVSPPMVLKRAGSLSKRPLINTDNPLETVRDLMQTRREFYSQADQVIETDQLTPEQIAEKIYFLIPRKKE